METYTWKTPKNNRNTEKFLAELKCLPDEEWIEKNPVISALFGGFRVQKTRNHSRKHKP